MLAATSNGPTAVTKGKYKTVLTRTGLLMEGLGKQSVKQTTRDEGNEASSIPGT